LSLNVFRAKSFSFVVCTWKKPICYISFSSSSQSILLHWSCPHRKSNPLNGQTSIKIHYPQWAQQSTRHQCIYWRLFKVTVRKIILPGSRPVLYWQI